VQQALLHGSGEDEIKFSYEDGVRLTTPKTIRGRHHQIDRRYANRERMGARRACKYFSDIPCEPARLPGEAGGAVRTKIGAKQSAKKTEKKKKKKEKKNKKK